MTATTDLLDMVKNKAGVPSDNVLSQRIGVTRATVSGWRVDLKPIPDERIAQLCAIAKLDGPEWMAKIHAERAQSPAERALWSKMLTRLAAAAFLLAPMSAFASTGIHANQLVRSAETLVMYIMSAVRRAAARILHPPELLTQSFKHA